MPFSSEDCDICSDCTTAFCNNGVCRCMYEVVLHPSDDENNLDYINAKPEQIQSEKAFAREMVTNKLESPETALQEPAQPKSKDQLAQLTRKCYDRKTSCSRDEGTFYLHLFKLNFIYCFYSRIPT